MRNHRTKSPYKLSNAENGGNCGLMWKHCLSRARSGLVQVPYGASHDIHTEEKTGSAECVSTTGP